VSRAPDPSEAVREARLRVCASLSRPDARRRWISPEDLVPRLGAVRGEELLVLVNRSPRFALDPAWAPSDLVDLRDGSAGDARSCLPPERQCLRREAAQAFGRLTAALQAAGHRPYIHSAFRSYGAQCGVFRQWAYDRGQGFCEATHGSALAGHSQHQLGTTVDLFTVAWAEGGTVMRGGFACTAGGRWLAAHAWEYGFVLPYPLAVDARDPAHPCRARVGVSVPSDPRTGYQDEPWHLRYVGAEAAARFHAHAASLAGTGREPTLEQWLRVGQGIAGDVDLPTCDGCACGQCSTFDASGQGPCGQDALVFAPDGTLRPSSTPRLLGASARWSRAGLRVTATVAVPLGVVTQTPVGQAFARGETFEGARLEGGLVHGWPDLPGAWRLAVRPAGDGPWPWRVGLRAAVGAAMQPVTAFLPATQGEAPVVLRSVPDAQPAEVDVALWRDDQPEGTVRVPVVLDPAGGMR
jgi:D-alanyl-D-alanine carboxypeptidase